MRENGAIRKSVAAFWLGKGQRALRKRPTPSLSNPLSP